MPLFAGVLAVIDPRTDPAAVYASLIHYLEEQRLMSAGPFDAEPCRGATIDDLDATGM